MGGRVIGRRALLAGVLAAPASFAYATTPFGADAAALIDLLVSQYAYRERLAGFPERRLRELRSQADAVTNRDQLIRFGERAIAAIFDHHAILNTALADSYGLVPSYGDIWIEPRSSSFVITDVRQNSPAARAGVEPGESLTHVDGAPIGRAIETFIEAPLSLLTPDQRAFCARVLAAGKRDRPRRFTLQRPGGARILAIDNVYASPIARDAGPLRSERMGGVGYVRFNDSLGASETMRAFASAVAQLRDAPALILDLRDTASGGNTQVARAIMGWFVDAPTPYQRHELTAESLDSGVRRSWIEEVSPLGETYNGRVLVLAGRWTGSMGEGLTIGMDNLGADIIGSKMAGLLGGIYNLPLPNSGIVLNLPVERLAHVDGTPREIFVPEILVEPADASRGGADPALAAALALLG